MEMENHKNNLQNSKILATEWILKAQDDEGSAEILLNEQGSANTICFLSQQMAEKLLKGYLVFRELEFPKIHDLARLLKLCEKSDPPFRKLKQEAQYLRVFYIVTRYPGDYPQFTFKEAKEAFNKAVKIKEFVLSKMKI